MPARRQASQVGARSWAMVLTFVAVALLVSGSIASASPPLREWFHQDVDVRLAGASAVCGFEIRGHFEGDVHFSLYYDNDGNIVKEVDTFPDFAFTVYAPSTGKSYTTRAPAVLLTQYTNNAVVGSPALAELVGLAEKIPALDMEAGRLVFEAVVVRIDAAGIPIIQGTHTVSNTGPNFDAAVRFQRCAAMQ